MKKNKIISPATAYQILLLAGKQEVAKEKLRRWLRRGVDEKEIEEIKEMVGEISLMTRDEFLRSFKQVVSTITDEYLKQAYKEVLIEQKRL